MDTLPDTIKKMLEYIRAEEEHECDSDGNPDLDLCGSCGDHASFCSDCNVSDCCGSAPYDTD